MSDKRDPSRELVPDEWRALDDTLADGPAPAQLPEPAVAWLAQQRFLHGLLRAVHTQDAAEREGRVDRLLARIDAERGATGGRRRHWALVAIAATVLASMALWFVLPERLPTAEAAVAQMVSQMERDVDRRFRARTVITGLGGRAKADHEFLLVTRPGMRFRVDGKLEFGGKSAGEVRVGCDGEELWLQSMNGLLRHAVPIARRENLMEKLGDALDLGYLDVHDFVRRLPEDLELTVAGRERDEAGAVLVRVEAKRQPGTRGLRPRLEAAYLLYSEDSGMIRRLEVETKGLFGVRRRFVLDYLGEEPAGLVDYGRPW